MMKSGNNFIYQVRDKIKNEHGKDQEASFIFGLSGKWGEGKTTFLKNLEGELEKNGFQVVWINPWKFGEDKISFLRNFLKEISAIRKRSIFDKLRDFINNQDDLRSLYYDTNYINVHWGILTVLSLFITLGVIIYWFLLPQAEQIYPGLLSTVKNRYLLIFGLFVSPFLIPLIGKTLTTQSGSKSISTIIEFDRLLTKYLNDLKGKKIVVFIDDLDRVTPDVARTVLDNMRIFFDKSEITFIVTGDHTVLERYIGSQTLVNGNDAEKLEEGRRYLKKIFNLYWRLPLPIESEFDSFLQGLILENKKELDKIFEKDGDKEIFSKYLKLYFDKNFRQVIRFFDTVLFTFRIIVNQHSSADEDKQKYFEQMLSKPLLVVRILMIQELCTPLFEAILHDTGKLRILEDYVERKDSGNVDKILKGYTFTDSQNIFIKQFLYEEPRFFKNKILEVYAFEPFLFLAADASFGDARGLSKEDFTVELKTGDPDQVANSIQNCGEDKVKDASLAIKELLKTSTDPIEKINYIHTLSLAFEKIPDHFSQSYFISAIHEQDYAEVFSGDLVPNRLEISLEFWRWLDSQKDESLKNLVDFFPLVQAEDLDKLNLNSKMGSFSSTVICRWLRDYYPSDKTSILDKMLMIFPQLDKKTISLELNTLTDQLIQDFLSASDVQQKDNIYKLLMEFLPVSKERFKTNILEKIKTRNEDIWGWAESKISDKYKPWTLDEIESSITNSIEESATSDELLAGIRYANGKIMKNADTSWQTIQIQKHALLMDIIGQLINAPLTSFIPHRKVALALFTDIVDLIESGDESKGITLLSLLQKQWIWEKIVKMPQKGKLTRLLESTNQEIVIRTKNVLDSWGLTYETSAEGDPNN